MSSSNVAGTLGNMDALALCIADLMLDIVILRLISLGCLQQARYGINLFVENVVSFSKRYVFKIQTWTQAKCSLPSSLLYDNASVGDELKISAPLQDSSSHL